MIVYLDTSALVKLYIEEEGTDMVKEITGKADVVATSRISFAEARSALVRCQDEKVISGNNYRQCITNLKSDWEMYLVLDASETVIQIAGELIENYRIRGFDGIHLASGLVLMRQVNEVVNFMCWDSKLWHAAKKEEFKIWPHEI